MLKLENISKSFHQSTVLEEINLEINTGEIVSILGQSGSGKTTLLNIILGLEEPSSGKLFFREKEITHTPMEKRPFNIVFQDYALFPNLTAYQNLTYGLKNKKNCSSVEEVQELICLLNLEKHLDKPIQQLSGGQKQRVALGRTLVMKPDLLLLDEPLSALDGVIKESIKEKIQEIARKLSLTIVIVTHDPEEALTMSDKIVVLDNGKIAQCSSPVEIMTQASCHFVQEFIINQLMVKQQNIQQIFQQALKQAET
ncbi:ABC transporter ATP-binding protein [Candidatus Enterococcus ferrettii]|uniref:Iron(III) transport system ATP-binding protein n=1 Tax=Candidatus Enterococcus ferrettii TaxID=2815324 RepID=A0ABV0EW32_9ENTE|nr:ABC transporter ATP-binding protein [Enterococcus sp. 665A]MBO1339976.1 ABC transporter ATP-binding protein [Enterococcus sp. 665A]